MKTNPKNILLLLVIVIVLGTFSACTLSQAVAGGNYIAGSDLATYVLGRHPGSVKALQHLTLVLPDIPTGKVKPFEMGQLNAELAPIFHEAELAHPDDASVFVRVGNLLSAGSQLSGQNPTVYQGMAMAAAMDFANGINEAIQFNAGRQSVTDPPVVASAKAKKAAVHR